MVPAGVRSAAWAAGSDAPEKPEVKIGFIPLTDCASVVIASEMGFDKKYGIKITPSQGSELGGGARQTGERRARCRACAVRPDLRRAARHRRPEEGHGRADGPQPQRPGDHALEPAQGQGRDRRRHAQDAHRQGKARLHLRPDLSHRHARHVALLLAGDLRHQPDERRQDHRRAAAADGGQHARRQHGRLLRRRAVGRARHLRQDRLHRHHHPGHLEGSPGEGARHAASSSCRSIRTPRAP